MPAPVVIDVGDAQPPRELVVALVEACSQAAAPAATECRLVRDAPNEPYSAIAIVTWEEGGKARVEVGVRRDPISEWRTRELTFQAQDAEVERYRSVGFVIGSLATATRDEAASKPATPDESPAEPPPPPIPTPVPVAVPPHEPTTEPTPSPPSGPSRAWMGLSGTIGGGLDRGAARYGGRLGGGFRVLPVLAAVVSGGASLRARDDTGLAAQWLDLGGGLAFTIWPPAGTHLELRAEVLAERFSADASNELEEQSMLRTTAAFRPGVDAVVVVAQPLAFVIGAEATFRPATTVNVQGEKAGSTRNFELGAAAGLRLDL
jgi:hypothetical protein